jgi:hypothetical protein
MSAFGLVTILRLNIFSVRFLPILMLAQPQHVIISLGGRFRSPALCRLVSRSVLSMRTFSSRQTVFRSGQGLLVGGLSQSRGFFSAATYGLSFWVEPAALCGALAIPQLCRWVLKGGFWLRAICGGVKCSPNTLAASEISLRSQFQGYNPMSNHILCTAVVGSGASQRVAEMLVVSRWTVWG